MWSSRRMGSMKMNQRRTFWSIACSADGEAPDDLHLGGMGYSIDPSRWLECRQAERSSAGLIEGKQKRPCPGYKVRFCDNASDPTRLKSQLLPKTPMSCLTPLGRFIVITDTILKSWPRITHQNGKFERIRTIPGHIFHLESTLN